MAVSFIGLIVFGGVVLGGLALLGMLLAHKQTRLLGVGLIGFGTFSLLLVTWFYLFRGQAIEEVRQATNELRVAEQQARAEAAFMELTEPRIDLSDDSPPPDAVAETVAESVAEGVAEAGETAVATPHKSKLQERSIHSATSDDGRPAWIDNPPDRWGDVYSAVLDSVGHWSQDECYASADAQIAKHAAYFAFHDQSQAGATPDQYTGYSLGVGISELRRRLVKDQYFERKDGRGGPLALYTLVEINEEDGRWLRNLRDAQRRRHGVGRIASLGGTVLGLLAVAFGLLKLDEATKGYYTKRLLIGVPAVIIGLILLMGLMLA